MTVYLKLRGPNDRGLPPKAAVRQNWQDPSYRGIGGDFPADYWVGMRLDDHVVVDCDNEEARDAWLKHLGHFNAGLGLLTHTWVRKTPHGWHFIYERRGTHGLVQAGKMPTVHPKIDLKLGTGHQIVFHAPGYSDLVPRQYIRQFDPGWVPSVKERDRGIPEWGQVPDGFGDNFMISVAGKMREWGASQEAIQAGLWALNERLMQEDPMPLQSIKRLARSACRYDTGESHEVMCPKCGTEFEVL